MTSASRTVSRVVDIYHKRYEEVWLGIYAILTLLPAVGILMMLQRAAGPEGGLEPTIGTIISFVNLTYVNLGAIFFGIYLGLLVLLYIDHKKRAQSILMGIATLVVFLGLLLSGIFFSFFTLIDVVLVAVSLITTVVFVGGEELRRLQVADTGALVRGRIVSAQGQEPVEFPKAERRLYYLLFGLVVIAFIEAHIQFDTLILSTNGFPAINTQAFDNFSVFGSSLEIGLDIASTAGFLIVSYQFIGYNSERGVVVVGPAGSGKTHLLLGLYKTASSHQMHPRNVGDALSMKEAQLRTERTWLDRSRDLSDLSFTYTLGKRFPKDIVVESMDYPGEWFPHIPYGIKYALGMITEETFEQMIIEQIQEGDALKDSQAPEDVFQGVGANTDGGQISTEESEGSSDSVDVVGEDDESTSDSTTGVPDIDTQDEVEVRMEHVVNQIVPGIMHSESVMFVLDMEAKKQDDESIGAEYFNLTLTQLNNLQRGKDVKLVATKADVYIDDFRDKHGISPFGEEGYELFREFIANKLSEGEGSGLMETTREIPYPVFYQTEVTFENGASRREPIIQAGDPNLYGFEELLKRLGR